VTKSALKQALKLIVRGKLTFDERVVLHRVVRARSKAREDRSRVTDLRMYAHAVHIVLLFSFFLNDLCQTSLQTIRATDHCIVVL